MEQLSQSWSNNVITDGVLASTLASFGTGVGAIPVLFTSQLSDHWRRLLLSIGGGVMLSAAAFSLLFPAVSLASEADGLMGLGQVAIALFLGATVLYGLESQMPAPELEEQAQARRIWLFVLVIALHHFPEGLAVGLGTASTQDMSLAIGVALQNLPEGLMVALALRELGYGGGFALAMATISGWLEPLGGALGVALADLGPSIAPFGMALAAGAMLFVVLHELLPELNLKQLNSSGSVGLATGLLVMAMVENVV